MPPARYLLLIAFLSLPLTACGGRETAGLPEGSGTTATVVEETTSSTGTTGTTAPSQPTVFTDQARDAVNELKAAWEAGDRPRAQAVAPPDVVEALFAIDPGGFEIYGCDTGEFDTSTCNFRNRSTGVYITVNNQRHDQGWQVATIYVDAG